MSNIIRSISTDDGQFLCLEDILDFLQDEKALALHLECPISAQAIDKIKFMLSKLRA
jgi:hypothetical protein